MSSTQPSVTPTPERVGASRSAVLRPHTTTGVTSRDAATSRTVAATSPDPHAPATTRARRSSSGRPKCSRASCRSRTDGAG
ncbi:hypothetical protein AB0C21_05225 [Spirillospora sp. NPDC049024]